MSHKGEAAAATVDEAAGVEATVVGAALEVWTPRAKSAGGKRTESLEAAHVTELSRGDTSCSKGGDVEKEAAAPKEAAAGAAESVAMNVICGNESSKSSPRASSAARASTSRCHDNGCGVAARVGAADVNAACHAGSGSSIQESSG